MTSDQPGYAGAPVGPVLASRGKRLLARIIDWVILGIVGTALSWGSFQDVMEVSAQYQTSENPFGLYTDPTYLGATATSGGISLVLILLYEGILTKLKGATLGKMAMGLRVEPVRGGQISWLQSIGRILVWYLPNYVTCSLWTIIDNIWLLWDDRKQTLHDKAAKTVVVATR